MSQALHRREFLSRAALGGFSLGGWLGLGLDERPLRAEVGRLRIKGGREVPSICPYCAVGCGQLVTARDGQIVNIEGNPESPVSLGTLCPKGAATYQLAVNPHRVTQVWYRAPGATEWDKTKSLDWAMDRIARLVKETRDATFQRTWKAVDGPVSLKPEAQAKKFASQAKEFASLALQASKAIEHRVNHTLAIASLGGATISNEWNYLQAKLMRSLGVVFLENQARV